MEVILKDYLTRVNLGKWQKDHDLGYKKLSDHIDIYQDNVTCEGELLICQDIIEVYEKIRREYGKPISINSGYRTYGYQNKLRLTNNGAAVQSPHCEGYAMDLDFEGDGNRLLVAVKRIRDEYNGLIRIGWKEYWKNKLTFIHVDVAPIAWGILKNNNVMFPDPWKHANCEW